MEKLLCSGGRSNGLACNFLSCAVNVIEVVQVWTKGKMEGKSRPDLGRGICEGLCIEYIVNLVHKIYFGGLS